VGYDGKESDLKIGSFCYKLSIIEICNRPEWIAKELWNVLPSFSQHKSEKLSLNKKKPSG
jgi:hypothetical protein